MKIKSLLVLLVLAGTLMAQTNYQAQYKKLAGRYGGNDGICLFEDGIFMLYGYATMVMGNYILDKDTIHFTPDKPDRFEIYATQNTGLGNTIRANFKGFENGETFVQFNKDSIQKVFNPDANCFSGPYVLESTTVPLQIRLFHHDEMPGWEQNFITNTVFTFDIEKGWNDFVVVFNEPRRYYEPFSALLHQAPDSRPYLIPSVNFGDRRIPRQDLDQDEQKQWNEILAVKAEYAVTNNATYQGFFANRHYKIFEQADPIAYTYDKKTNLYTSKQAKDNEDYYRHNAYNDDRYLRKYSRLKAANTRTIDKLDKVAPGSIFYSSCEGELPTYKYKELDNENKVEPESLKTIPAPNNPGTANN